MQEKRIEKGYYEVVSPANIPVSVGNTFQVIRFKDVNGEEHAVISWTKDTGEQKEWSVSVHQLSKELSNQNIKKSGGQQRSKKSQKSSRSGSSAKPNVPPAQLHHSDSGRWNEFLSDKPELVGLSHAAVWDHFVQWMMNNVGREPKTGNQLEAFLSGEISPEVFLEEQDLTHLTEIHETLFEFINHRPNFHMIDHSSENGSIQSVFETDSNEIYELEVEREEDGIRVEVEKMIIDNIINDLSDLSDQLTAFKQKLAKELS